MLRALLAALLATTATAATGAEKLGVIAIADPPAGPDADLAELAHQLRAACRDRIGGVEDVPSMRARLLGQTSNATLSELDRAYGGALAVYQNGEFESAIRTLRAIVEDLESIPEGQDAYMQWQRALLRLAHAAATIGVEHEVDTAFDKLARTDPTLRPSEEQFSPGYRRRFEAMKAKVKTLPRRKLTVLAEGAEGVVYVNGREMGAAPLSISLPAGKYRVGGAAGPLRVPSLVVDLASEDRNVVLDFALADAVRVNAGPGLALPLDHRAYGIIRAGAWLGVDKLIVTSRIEEGGPPFLLGSIFDVRRGALLREGSVRMVAGSVPAANVGALAAFLLTGQSSRGVEDRTREAPREQRNPAPSRPAPLQVQLPATLPLPAPAIADARREPAAEVASSARPARSPATQKPSAPSSPAAQPSLAAQPLGAARPLVPPSLASEPLGPTPSAPGSSLALTHRDRREALPGPAAMPRKPFAWKRPTAIAGGIAALLFGGIAVQQGLSASGSHSDMAAMLDGNGVVKDGDLARYRSLESDANAATRNAYVSAGATLVFAATAGVLGWQAWGPDRQGPSPLAFQF